MPYDELGYDQFFNASISQPQTSLSSIDNEIFLEGIGAESLLSSGSVTSSDGRLAMNLDTNSFSVSDGVIERVRLGSFDDGEYGLRIKDRNGNVLLDITGVTNILRSSDDKMQIDLTNKQLRVYDDKNLRILLGEL